VCAVRTTLISKEEVTPDDEQRVLVVADDDEQGVLVVVEGDEQRVWYSIEDLVTRE